MSTLSEALAPKSDQLNADELIPGPRVLKITGGRVAKDGRQTRIILSFEGDGGKPFKPCKTMGRAMVMLWALTDEGFEEQVKGKSIRVYRDPEVTFGDQGQVGGIRISHASHIAKVTAVKLTVSQGKKSIFTFHPLVTDAASGAAKPKQTAADWADDHIAFVVGAASTERLASVQEAGKKAMAKLQASEPDLHAKVTAAYAKRLDELSPIDAFDPATGEVADDDPFSEGRSDDQHGDQHDGADEQAEQA